jgi:DNA-binding XRE family transcriptional regulator
MMSDLKTLRTMAGRTQYELSRESGVPRWKISLIEANQLAASSAEEAALRGALGKSLQALATKAAEVGHRLSQEAIAV